MSQQGNPSVRNKQLAFNAAIGFLSLLLLFLLISLFTRIVYPRIQNQREANESVVVSDVIQIEVLNGCGIGGVANTFTQLLRKGGFDVVESGNFEHFELQESIVISRGKNFSNALRVAQALGIDEKNVIREESPDFYLDATVVIGFDYEQLKIR